MVDFSGLLARIDQLGALIRSRPVFRWATVTNASPLQIKLDGDTNPLAGSPLTLIGDLVVGDRVRVEQQGTRLTVHGKAKKTDPVVELPEIPKPEPPPKVDTTYLTINGTSYQADGAWTVSFDSWAYAQGGVWALTLIYNAPYTPPAGWTFQAYMLETTGYTLAHTAYHTSLNKIGVRLIQFGSSSTTAAKKIGWRLVRATN